MKMLCDERKIMELLGDFEFWKYTNNKSASSCSLCSFQAATAINAEIKIRDEKIVRLSKYTHLDSKMNFDR